MNPQEKRKLGEILIENGTLLKEQLQDALEYQSEHPGLLGQILIAKGYLTEEDLSAALSKQLKIPYIPLKSYSINPQVTTLIPLEFCREYRLVPFDGNQKRISVALADPLNHMGLEGVRDMTKKMVDVFIAKPSEISETINFIYKDSGSGNSVEAS